MAMYGNVINRVMENVTAPTPFVGMPATVVMWSDRHAYTVTKVFPGAKRVELTRDRVTKFEGPMGERGVEFEPAATTITRLATLRRNGAWKLYKDGTGVVLGSRSEYRDPSF